jgi:cell division protein FtsZ
VHPEANIIFGATIDDALGDEVRVTVIAAGFDGGMPKRSGEGTVLRRDTKPVQTQEETRAAAQALASGEQEQEKVPAGSSLRSQASTTPDAAASGAKPAPRQVQFDDDDLDIPDFLK